MLSGIAELERDPCPAWCKKLASEPSSWRIRIGDYMILYDIIDNTLVVTVVRVAHRREVYK
nr:type II toxin-antitoxin system RelE/ParE family toxin [Arthrobacter sp. MYb227]